METVDTTEVISFASTKNKLTLIFITFYIKLMSVYSNVSHSFTNHSNLQLQNIEG